jgi:hypothetical protein
VIQGPCTFLEDDGERKWCGLIRRANPEEAARLRAVLHVGAGCCANMNPWRQKILAENPPDVGVKPSNG